MELASASRLSARPGRRASPPQLSPKLHSLQLVCTLGTESFRAQVLSSLCGISISSLLLGRGLRVKLTPLAIRSAHSHVLGVFRSDLHRFPPSQTVVLFPAQLPFPTAFPSGVQIRNEVTLEELCKETSQSKHTTLVQNSEVLKLWCT